MKNYAVTLRIPTIRKDVYFIPSHRSNSLSDFLSKSLTTAYETKFLRNDCDTWEQDKRLVVRNRLCRTFPALQLRHACATRQRKERTKSNFPIDQHHLHRIMPDQISTRWQSEQAESEENHDHKRIALFHHSDDA